MYSRWRDLVGGRHPDGEEVLDGCLPDALAPEIEPGVLQLKTKKILRMVYINSIDV